MCLRATLPIARGSSSNSRSLVVQHPVGSAGVLSSRAPLKPPDERRKGGMEGGAERYPNKGEKGGWMVGRNGPLNDSEQIQLIKHNGTGWRLLTADGCEVVD